MDLNDENINGGLISDHTVGLNWWLNPYTRMMWDYVNSRSTPGDPAATPMTTQHIYEMRVAIEF
jgi:phosphate-selective porin OprO/OprP